jgi:AcrR family transcriptional regulator
MRRDERLRQILDAAARVLSEKGHHGMTIRDVADEAGTSVGLVYRHAASKEDLLYQVERRILEAAVTSAEAALVARKARDRLKAVVTDHVRRVLARPGEALVIRGGASPLSERRRRSVQALRDRYHALVGVAVDEVVRPAVRRRKDTERRTQMLLAMADRSAFLASEGALGSRPDRLANAVLGLFLDGARGRGARGAGR